VLQYQEAGFLPDALLNYLVRLGWSHGDHEVFTREQMIEAFDIKDVNKAASAFNAEKLLWLNQQHMMRASIQTLVPALRAQLATLGVIVNDERLLEGVVSAQRERATTLREMAQNSLFFFRDFDAFDEKAARKTLTPDAAPLLSAAAAALASLPDWNAATIHSLIEQLAQQHGVSLGKIAQPLRVAVSGRAVSPPIDSTLALLGRRTVQARIQRALAAIPAS
jgi:glutamyl-tRNA synthetase